MMPRPNKIQEEAIRNMAQNGTAFRFLVEWLEEALADVRRGNDSLPLNEVQVGQGRAQALNAEIEILKDLTGVSPD